MCCLDVYERPEFGQHAWREATRANRKLAGDQSRIRSCRASVARDGVCVHVGSPNCDSAEKVPVRHTTTCSTAEKVSRRCLLCCDAAGDTLTCYFSSLCSLRATPSSVGRTTRIMRILEHRAPLHAATQSLSDFTCSVLVVCRNKHDLSGSRPIRCVRKSASSSCHARSCSSLTSQIPTAQFTHVALPPISSSSPTLSALHLSLHKLTTLGPFCADTHGLAVQFC